MEPLCCLSSCTVREGCHTIIVFELIYVIITIVTISVRVRDDHESTSATVTSIPQPSFSNALASAAQSHIFVIPMGVFDTVMICMAYTLARGISCFDREKVHLHLVFSYIALIFNVVYGMFCAAIIIITFADHLNVKAIILLTCCTFQSLSQFWAISILKSCKDYFLLLRTLVTMAEEIKP
ncbi:hypothetical protein AB6A40_006042 [Gnathostoma spinigerum]|uniref:Uncharacterized protein n=1 Tax=Gnathostoma spinigerum TaxID=75299 RepID=A0ABD6EQP9_9BILA